MPRFDRDDFEVTAPDLSYKNLRFNLHWQAQQAKRAADIYKEWNSPAFAGLVRLVALPDDHCNMEDLKGDCYDYEKSGYTGTRAQLEREEKEFEEKVASDGVYGILGEYRVSEDSPWIEADSCWGFVGDDWKFSGYAEDIMSETMEQLTAAVCNVASL